MNSKIKIFLVITCVFIAKILVSQTIPTNVYNTPKEITVDTKHDDGSKDYDYFARERVVFKASTEDPEKGFSYRPQFGHSLKGRIEGYLETAPDINKPIDQTLAVGAIKGMADVSQTGAALYQIPIYCPPGTNGMTPNISINYNSQGANRELGWGFGLSCVSVISRVNPDYYHDKNKAGIRTINFDNTDVFTLDGQRLILINGNNGENEAEYGTEMENFSRIKCNSKSKTAGPEYFIVETKEGMTYEYGKADDAKMYADVTQQNKTVAVWLLNRATDPNGNYILYKYNNINGEMLLAEVQYTGTESNIPYNSVKFYYSGKTDKNRFYSGMGINKKPVVIPFEQLLKRIEIICEDKKVKMYNLNYTLDYYSKLSEIEEYNSAGEKSNSTIIEWSKIISDVRLGNSNTSIEQLVTFDIDNNGVSDIFKISNNKLIKQKRNFNSILISDYNEIDISLIKDKNTTNWLTIDVNNDDVNEVYINEHIKEQKTVEKFNSGSFAKQQPANDYDPNTNTCSECFLFTGDQNIYCIYKDYVHNEGLYCLNGQEKLCNVEYERDVNECIIPGSIKTYEYYYYKNGYKLYKIENSKLIRDDESYDFVTDSASMVFEGDFEGDGIIEILARKDENLFLKKGTIITSLKDVIPYNRANGDSLYVFDFNGNGISDIMVCSDNTTIYEYINGVFNIIYTGGYPTKYHRVYTGDFNGDGKTDILTSSPDVKTWWVNYSSGFNFDLPLNVKIDLTLYNVGDDAFYNPPIIKVADFNGDGKTDILEILKHQKKDKVLKEKWVLKKTKIPTFPFFKIEFVKEEYYVDELTDEWINTFNIFYSYGNSFTKESYSKENAPRGGQNFDRYNIGDYNGDGKLELFYNNVYNDGSVYQFTDFITYKQADQEQNPIYSNHLVKKIRDGIGATVEYNYRLGIASSDNQNLGFPIKNYKGVSINVYKLIIPEGEFYYSFSNPVIHCQGKGFIGYLNSTKTDMGITSCSKYKIEPSSYSLLLKESSIPQIEETKFTNNVKQLSPDPDNKRYLFTTTKVEKRDLLVDNKQITDYTYDDDGNVIKNVTNYYSGNLTGSSNTFETNEMTYTAVGSVFLNKVKSVKTTQKSSTDNNSFVVNKEYSYNERGLLIQSIVNAGTDQTKKVKTEYVYNTLGNVLLEKVTGNDVANPLTTSSTYDNYGRYIISSKNALGNTTTYEREPVFGNILKEKNILGHETIYNYDNNGSLKQTIYPNGNTVDVEIKWDDSNPNLDFSHYIYKKIKGKNMPEQKTYYNMGGLVVKTEVEDINGKKVCTETQYENRKLISAQSKPYFTNQSNIEGVSYFYNNYTLRLESISDPETSQEIEYTYNGKTTTETFSNDDGPPIQKYKTINELGQLVKVTDNGGDIEYKYNSQGLPTEIKYSGNNTVSFTYDINGNRTKIVDPNAGTITNEYNSFNQVTKQTDAKGNVTEYKYDAFGRIIEVKGNNRRTIAYKYNETGNGIEQIGSIELKENNKVNHRESYDYDTYGRVIKVITEINVGKNKNTYTRSFVYDQYGNLTEETTPSGLIVKRQYNSNGFNTKVTAIDANSKSYDVWEFGASEADGRIVNYKMGKDNMIDRTYNYTDNGYLSRITSNVTKNNEGQEKIQDFEYTFNPKIGNLKSRKDVLFEYFGKTETFISMTILTV